MVLAHADVLAREDVCTSLTNDNRPGSDGFAVIYLNSQVFWVGISTVLGGSA